MTYVFILFMTHCNAFKITAETFVIPLGEVDCANKESNSFFQRRNGFSFDGYGNMMESRAKVLAGIMCN